MTIFGVPVAFLLLIMLVFAGGIGWWAYVFYTIRKFRRISRSALDDWAMSQGVRVISSRIVHYFAAPKDLKAGVNPSKALFYKIEVSDPQDRVKLGHLRLPYKGGRSAPEAGVIWDTKGP